MKELIELAEADLNLLLAGSRYHNIFLKDDKTIHQYELGFYVWVSQLPAVARLYTSTNLDTSFNTSLDQISLYYDEVAKWSEVVTMDCKDIKKALKRLVYYLHEYTLNLLMNYNSGSLIRFNNEGIFSKSLLLSDLKKELKEIAFNRNLPGPLMPPYY